MDYVSLYNLRDDSVFQEIDYDEFMKMFETLQTGLVLLGGAWCKNARLIVPYLNRIAIENNVEKIYNFDLKYFNDFGVQGDLRTGTSLDHRLEYFNIAEKTGIESEKTVGNTMMPRIPSPTLIAIRNGSCVDYITFKYIKDECEQKSDLSIEEQQDFKEKVLKLISLTKTDDRFKL